MAVQIIALVLEADGLTPAQKAVCTALANCANEDGRSVYPSIPRIMINTALGRTAVRNALQALKDMKLIILVRKSMQHRANEYRFNLEMLKSMKHADLDENGRLRRPAYVTVEDDSAETGEEEAAQGDASRPSEEVQSVAKRPPEEIQSAARRPPESQSVVWRTPEGRLADSRGSPGDPDPSLNRHLNPSLKSDSENLEIWNQVLDYVTISCRDRPSMCSPAERIAKKYLEGSALAERDGETFTVDLPEGNLRYVQERYGKIIEHGFHGLGYFSAQVIFRPANTSPVAKGVMMAGAA